MRFVLAAAFLLALMAGCASDDSAEEPAAPAPEAGTDAPIPAPIHEEQDFTLALDPTNVATGQPCFGPSVDPPCYYYEVQVETMVDFVATLSWTLEANDFDLYLYEGETQVSSDGINTVGAVPPEPPATTQVMRHEALPPGDYRFYVVAWNAAADTTTLDVEFTAS